MDKKNGIRIIQAFLYARLNKLGLASTIKQAKKLVEKERDEVWMRLKLQSENIQYY